MSFRSRITAFLAALSLGACATVQEPAPAPAGAGPALWQVADADTKIYLFGTIHMLPQGLNWRTPAIDRALAEADELVFELSTEGDPQENGRTMLRMGRSAGLPPLVDRVPRGKRKAMQRAIAASGYPEATLNQLESWAAAFVLSAASLRNVGVSAGAGVEQMLGAEFRQRGKPIRALETIEQQFGYFDTMPERAQRKMLESALDKPADARAQFQKTLEMWRRGDVEGISRAFSNQSDETPELRGSLLSRRNANWARWIDDRLDRPGVSFVAVGAAHLGGKDSVQEMLRGRGLTATRLQ